MRDNDTTKGGGLYEGEECINKVKQNGAVLADYQHFSLRHEGCDSRDYVVGLDETEQWSGVHGKVGKTKSLRGEVKRERQGTRWRCSAAKIDICWRRRRRGWQKPVLQWHIGKQWVHCVVRGGSGRLGRWRSIEFPSSNL